MGDKSSSCAMSACKCPSGKNTGGTKCSLLFILVLLLPILFSSSNASGTNVQPENLGIERTLVGYGEQISVTWLQDNSKLASFSSNGTIHIWDVSNGSLIRNVSISRWFSSPPLSVSWSPERTCVAVGAEGFFGIFNVSDCTLIQNLSGHIENVKLVAWSPDGTKLVSVSDVAQNLSVIRIWNANDGTLIMNLTGHHDRVSSIAWSPDGTKFASGGCDGTVKIWNASDGLNLANLTATSSMPYRVVNVTSLSWSVDGTKLAAGTDANNKVLVWNTSNWNWISTVRPYFGSGVVKQLVWANDGDILVMSSSDGTIRFWETTTWTAWENKKTLYFSGVSTMVYSPDGSNFAFNSGNTIIVLGKDRDGDGYADLTDDFPNDPTQWEDSDKDGHGDSWFGNNPDDFPNDPAQWEEKREGGNFVKEFVFVERNISLHERLHGCWGCYFYVAKGDEILIHVKSVNGGRFVVFATDTGKIPRNWTREKLKTLTKEDMASIEIIKELSSVVNDTEFNGTTFFEARTINSEPRGILFFIYWGSNEEKNQLPVIVDIAIQNRYVEGIAPETWWTSGIAIVAFVLAGLYFYPKSRKWLLEFHLTDRTKKIVRAIAYFSILLLIIDEIELMLKDWKIETGFLSAISVIEGNLLISVFLLLISIILAIDYINEFATFTTAKEYSGSSAKKARVWIIVFYTLIFLVSLGGQFLTWSLSPENMHMSTSGVLWSWVLIVIVSFVWSDYYSKEESRITDKKEYRNLDLTPSTRREMLLVFKTSCVSYFILLTQAIATKALFMLALLATARTLWSKKKTKKKFSLLSEPDEIASALMGASKKDIGVREYTLAFLVGNILPIVAFWLFLTNPLPPVDTRYEMGATYSWMITIAVLIPLSMIRFKVEDKRIFWCGCLLSGTIFYILPLLFKGTSPAEAAGKAWGFSFQPSIILMGVVFILHISFSISTLLLLKRELSSDPVSRFNIFRLSNNVLLLTISVCVFLVVGYVSFSMWIETSSVMSVWVMLGLWLLLAFLLLVVIWAIFRRELKSITDELFDATMYTYGEAGVVDALKRYPELAKYGKKWREFKEKRERQELEKKQQEIKEIEKGQEKKGTPEGEGNKS